MQHRPLDKLLAPTNIVEAYEETYGLQRVRSLSQQPRFLEDRRYVWVEEPDLLEKMIEEAESNNVNHTTMEIVEEYRPRGLHDPREYRKFIASSSQQEVVPDRRDSSSDSIERHLQKGYDTDQRSDHSDFSRKQSYQQPMSPHLQPKQHLLKHNPTAMQIQSQPEQIAPQTPTKPCSKPQRYPMRTSTRSAHKPLDSKPLTSTGCNCRKSHCLKMYCQCFHLKVFCSEYCSCKGCGNMEKTTQQQQAIIEALARNPKAFEEEQNPEGVVGMGFQLGVDLQEVRKGCKCRKTKCIKKYCECFGNGEKCSVFCRCEGCENGKDQP